MRLPALLVALGVLGGCAGAKPYPNEGAGNVVVRADLDRSVRAELHVHAVDRNCRTEYLGRVALQRLSTVVAIAPDRLSYLVVTFDTSSFLRGASSASAGTLLAPRAGQSYELAVSYRANLYDVALPRGEPQHRPPRSRRLPRFLKKPAERVLDSSIPVPGTRFTIGLDALIPTAKRKRSSRRKSK
jgi:hypothetical protein